MATYHLTVNAGAKGKAEAHAAYIFREGKYTGRERYEDLESTAYGNMPKWAEHNPAHFWQASDQQERANGTAYREIEIALPRELTPSQRRELVMQFVQQELGDRHAYQWAIHKPKAALEGDEQPHAHIMYSERMRDGIERDPDRYFRRYNSKDPERGGSQKASGGKTHAERQAELVGLRERWATVQNAHLERHGHAVRVDHRSLEAQGIDRAPEKHLGGRGVRQLQEADISALLERRAAEGERERAQQQVFSVIDLSADLAAAKAERERLNVEPKPLLMSELAITEPEKQGLFTRLKSALTRPKEAEKPELNEEERRHRAEALRQATIEEAKAEARFNEARAKAAAEAESLNVQAKPSTRIEAKKQEEPEKAQPKKAVPSLEQQRKMLEEMPLVAQVEIYKRLLKDHTPEKIFEMYPDMVKRLHLESARRSAERNVKEIPIKTREKTKKKPDLER